MNPFALSIGSEMLDCIEKVFIEAGKAGANGNTRHPLRRLWIESRRTLIDAGRLNLHGRVVS